MVMQDVTTKGVEIMRRYDERLAQVERVVGPREFTAADLVASPEWRQLHALIVAALKPYPEASQAVVDHVRAFYEGAGVTQRRRR
jgi:glutathione S-transferase